MKSRKPTEVCITVDTEFSIGGNFDNPELPPVAEPIVLGEIDGKEHGLGFLLDSFSEFGVRATFFVEALQTAYFGDEPMGRIARRIAQAGQDVQLHLHPCWLHYESTSTQDLTGPPKDSCADRSDAELDHFFQFGLSAFSRWGLPRPVAVRSGNFEVDVNFYRGAARSGIVLSSSIALPVRRPSDEALVIAGSRCRIEQVWEFPVFSYSYPLGLNKRLRPLAITACSSAEILSALWQAREHGISPVIILTHPQEYVKRRDSRYATLRCNRVNQTRLKIVLQFLRQHGDEFVTVPIYAIEEDHPCAVGPYKSAISVSARQAIARMAENAINNLVWWY
jgi:peptidoglycan/xylan/chitin deacetylase (PgdA/CDA1 family)